MIRIELPFLPPTTNHAYTTDPWGNRVLTKAGKKFKNEAKTHIARHYRKELLAVSANKPYLVLLKLYFERIENKGWPEKAKNRYKTLDGTNRIKLAEDALASAMGVDDASNMTFIVAKEVGIPERSVILIWSLEDEECVLYEFVKHYN